MSQIETEISQFGYKQELKRSLGLKELTIYGMVFMAPLAPMQVYGMVAQQSFGMSCLVYIVGVIAMLFTAYSYSHMAKEFPISGSVYSYIQRAVNPHVGFVAGWIILADYVLLPALLYSMTGNWMTGIFPNVPSSVWALLFIAINTYINIRGITVTSRLNMIMFYVQVVVIAAVLIVGINYVFIGGHGTGGFTLDPFFQSEHFNFGLIATSTTIAVLGFLGFDGISTLSEEATEPRKTVGKATVLSIVFIGFFFVAQAYIAHLIHPNYTNLDPDLGYFNILKEAGGTAFYVVIILINVVAIAGAVNLNCMAATSRILFSMSRDNLLPFSNVFKKIHPKYQSPVNSTYLSAIICAVTVLTLPTETILMFVNFGAVTSFMILNLCVCWYFFFKKRNRGLKSFIYYLVMPLIGFGIVTFVWSGFTLKTFIFGACWLILGITVGAVKSGGYKIKPPAFRE
ncbi:APC family permease [Bacillus paramycoides]|uniref:APC family permease n=1 Tax=Bacillus paramycoides TaxID=2026194 RepID=UPI002E1E16A9|nr:APC family permease [Bacillus paramycoides]